MLRTRDAVIFGLARLTESRDLETGNHLERISIYSTRLASAARRDPRFYNQITPSFVKLIGISSVLHDIGKVGIRDSILLKPGKLERQERPLMQLHAAIGGKCIREIESRLGKSNFLTMAREIAFNHHERWDGRGYPKGLAGDEIPLAARIVAIADVYDALSTKRVYREALPHEKCVEMIRSQAGRQFDPALVEIFLKVESEFREIAQQNCGDASRTAKTSGRRPRRKRRSSPRRAKPRWSRNSRCSRRRLICAPTIRRRPRRLRGKSFSPRRNRRTCPHRRTAPVHSRIGAIHRGSRQGARVCRIKRLHSTSSWKSS